MAYFCFTELDSPVDRAGALIYLWEVRDKNKVVVYRYVGKANHGARRPTRHYSRNVQKLLEGRPYRRGNPRGFRRVHRCLAAAALNGYEITLRFIRNVGPADDILAVEKKEQDRYGCAQFDCSAWPRYPAA